MSLEVFRSIEMTLSSLRLDRYYSPPSYVDELKGTKIFLISKKN